MISIMRLLIMLVFLSTFFQVHAQTDTEVDTSKVAVKIKKTFSRMPMLGKRTYTYNYKRFSQYYEYENPEVGWRSPLRNNEPIIVDFEPILTLNVYNDFEEKFSNNKLMGMKYYFAFRPQFRMYSKRSKPVSMPSYRVFLGLRHLYRISARHYAGFGFESGHYSNGQSGCSLGGSNAENCDSILASITPLSNLSEMINRQNGDFSTNLTQLTLHYRYVAEEDAYNKPKQVHSATFGVEFYHNLLFGMFDVGGNIPSAFDLYGRQRYRLEYAYTYQWQNGYRVGVSESIEVIGGAHPHINPFRSVLTGTVFLPRNMGLYIRYIYGHDNYNLRFVDSGHQFGIGFTWDMFPPEEVMSE